MTQDDEGAAPRKSRSAFALLTSWLFSKRNTEPVKTETEFLNTRDGYELAKFAQKAFGNDESAKKAHEDAVAAEQAHIDALLQGTDVVQINHQPVAVPPVAATPAARAPVAPPKPIAAPPAPVPVAASAPAVKSAVPAATTLPTGKAAVELAVRHLDTLHEMGMSVETLAEALIVIESREVKKRSRGSAG